MSFPRYPEYKDSGVEWLGDVPGHWLVGKVKHITSFFTGWTPPTGNAAFYEGENPWANISDLGPKWLVEPSKRISDDAVGHSGIRLSPTGSLLFSFKLSIGQVSFAARDMYTNEAIATFPPSERLNLEFAYYALPLYVVQNASENIYGAKLLNQELIKAAAVAVPSIHEQQAIATFLDREIAKIDALVAEQEKLIALLQEKRQAVISHAVTKGLDSNAPMKDSGVEWLGEVPGHWEVRPLKHAVQFRSGGTPDKSRRDYWDGEIPWASAKDLKVDNLSDTADHITSQALADGAASLVKEGSVLVVVRGMILARTFPVVTAMTPMAINQDLKAVTAKMLLHKAFLPWLLRGTETESLNRLDEAGHGTKALRMDAWGAMPIPMPPTDEQAEIAEFLGRATAHIDALVDEARIAITLLQERRTALISAAVTGQIDVRGLVGSANAPDSIAASAYPASA